MFLYRNDDASPTRMMECSITSVRPTVSIWSINYKTDRLVVAVHRIGHHSHRIWTHYITLCGVTWKLWCMHTRWTREKKYFSEFSALQEVLRKITSSLVKRVRKCIQADGGHFEQLSWLLKRESASVHLTTYLNKCTMLLFTF
jgi:hypothetical protein